MLKIYTKLKNIFAKAILFLNKTNFELFLDGDGNENGNGIGFNFSDIDIYILLL